MARWQAGAADRLEQAALDLFLEQGFVETTVPQITTRAGLTTRTFFRHFADKRDVLFRADADVPRFVQRLMAEAPPTLEPMTLISTQLSQFAEQVFATRRDILLLQHRIIETDPSLQDRKRRKMATLREAMMTGFLQRGTPELVATLAADLAISVLGTALERWLAGQSTVPLAAYIAEGLQALDTLTRRKRQEPPIMPPAE
ncbi:TetR/AcrR family transcriptional regulator (plasmid) [Deinococcus sp. KNUC1210]|uniref:TetR/AcrR family transcriptional regulator n=1 Tax=Deinococcus sp. KNUC1210 TaxID=2917691 RepID=UPI001EF027FB|nr:TetR/AcrR family transcriptional regulator [Deinococcus sp. KNUC1210]ULH18306.1 TetR/AcrR family transcriptional regulator [Deinococcus sp. KNUC1210]